MPLLDEYSDREFHSFFGISKDTILFLWAFVQTITRYQDEGMSLDKLLWTLFFLKVIQLKSFLYY